MHFLNDEKVYLLPDFYFYVIIVLNLLVFILTLFSMMQQNDYSLLVDEYYKQAIELRKMRMEIDSLYIAN